MEEIKLNQIRIAHLFHYVNETRSPFAVKASNYGNSSLTVGYLDEDIFVNKNGEKYNIYKYSVINNSLFGKVVFDKKPNYNETFASIIEKPLTKSRNSISREKIGLLLDEIEKMVYSSNLYSNNNENYTLLINKVYNKIKN